MGVILEKLVRREILQNYIRGSGIEIWAPQLLLQISSSSAERYLEVMPVVPLWQRHQDLWRHNRVNIALVENDHLLSVADNSCDFVLVNHQIERCPDPISALKNYLRVLKTGGVAYVAVSDKRYTFNCYRPSSSLDRLILNYTHDRELSRAFYFEEWIRLVEIAIFNLPEEKCGDRLQYHLEKNSKIHFNVWTSDEFLELLSYCKKQLGFSFEIEAIERNGPEFIVVISKTETSVIPTERVEKRNEFEESYRVWLNQNFPRQADLRRMAETIGLFKYKPTISVIVPVFNTPERFLREAIESVLNQIYPYWELCVADDASTEDGVKDILQEYAAKDARVKVVFREENGHISRASNSALEIATGEFVALLDHDDLFSPDALYEVALLLNWHPDADMIYSDEDKIDDRNQLRDPLFKPDWCPDSFLSRMYTCHLGVYRRAIAIDIGGFRVGYEGSQDYDFVLRFTEKTDKIYHIPKILYHWRIHPDSTASSLENKNYATDASVRAIMEATYRRGEPAFVKITSGGHAIARYHIQDYSRVSIVIPTRDLGSVLNKCLSSIFEKTVYPNYEVLVIDNGSIEPETLEIFDKWRTLEPERFRCELLDIPFNYSKINNYGVTQTEGKYLLFLNNDTEVLTPDWVNAMVEQAQRPSIGAVGALLLYPDDTVQHAGVVVGLGGVAGHSHKHFNRHSPGYFYQLQTVNNYSAMTAACLMCRRDVFDAVGGFEEELKIAFNDIDFCLKLVEKGYRNIYLPHVVLYHYESKSRGFEDTPEKQARFAKEIAYMRRKWQKIIQHDPCYSPHLTRDREDYSINV